MLSLTDHEKSLVLAGLRALQGIRDAGQLGSHREIDHLCERMASDQAVPKLPVGVSIGRGSGWGTG